MVVEDGIDGGIGMFDICRGSGGWLGEFYV